MSTEKQIVIQCPACQTKFALDSTLLEGIDEPRFHCSRCDHVFGVEDSIPSSLEPIAKKKELSIDQDPPSWSAPARAASATSKRKLEIPEKPAEPLNISAPHEDADDLTIRDVEAENDAQMEFNFSRAAEEEETEAPAAKSHMPQFSMRDDFADEAPIVNVEKDEDPAFVARPAADPSDAPGFKTAETTCLPEPRQYYKSEGTSELNNLAAKVPAYTPSWSGFAILSGVLMGFLALLVAGSLYLRSDTTSASSLVQSLFPKAQRIAPAGLYIKNTRLNKVTLDNGDSIHVVTGRVVNQTSEKFSTVIIEAIAFDALGKPLVRTRVDASNTLAKTRVKSLTLDMIKNRQTSEPFPGFALKPGANEDFAIALGNGGTSDEIAKARYFSARIYSVRS